MLRADKLKFNLDSFDYLATVARAQLAIIAGSDAPFDDVDGLAAYSREHDGALVGFDAKPQELLMKYIDQQTGAGFKLVSTKSSAEMVQNLLGGHIVASFAAGAHLPYIESGDIKMIASANAGRHTYAPDTPTLPEQGFDIYVDPYFFIAAPAGLPDDAKSALAGALANAIASTPVREVTRNTLMTEPSDLGPEGTRDMLVGGIDNVRKLFGK